MHNFWLAEILLALAAALVANQYWVIDREHSRPPALLIVAALVCLSLAAGVGAYRYGIDPGITQLHRVLSQLSAYVTFPLIGLGLLWGRLGLPKARGKRAPAYGVLVLVVGSALIVAEAGSLPPRLVGSLYSALGLTLWLLVAVWELIFPRSLRRPLALILISGALLVILAGAVVGTDATRVLGVARMNWFHLCLAAGALTLLCARPIFICGRSESE
ncbi:hypothetical protein OQJ68_07280 [Microbulbifer thermotolerans]|uniref:DMSO reductase anchor subunit n=1 Tax=Microbulbifer thermotolerans TaxID=252514 RepID=A0AB35HWA6_MICTH|nr:hypothetical protein [Microbulbifer thermotolerans]MCX2801584.1 hypothetical protein [Microbulbifer thermotolerans]